MDFQTQQSELLSWLDDGVLGLQRMVDVLRSPDVALRRVAYDLLMMLTEEEIAQDAVAAGFPLYPGDVIYEVYESAIAYNDCWYDLITQVDYLYWDEPIVLLGSYLDRAQAEASVTKHHARMAIADLSGSNRHLFDTSNNGDNPAYNHFPILEWCQYNEIPIRWSEESDEGYADRFAALTAHYPPSPELNQFFLEQLQPIDGLEEDQWDLHNRLGRQAVTFLVAVQAQDLMAKLWMEIVGPLAFIHERVVSQITYCDFHADRSIIVLKNHLSNIDSEG
jgi:hypothetical protein